MPKNTPLQTLQLGIKTSLFVWDYIGFFATIRPNAPVGFKKLKGVNELLNHQES